MDREGAASLMKKVLAVYDDDLHGPPQRVVVHKTSRYTEEERKGFEETLAGVRDTALVTLSHRGIVCLRPGSKPVLRGTAIDFRQRKVSSTRQATFPSSGAIQASGFLNLLK